MPTTTVRDWDLAYRTGEHHQYWESSAPSPELVGYLAASGSGTGRVALDIGCGTGWDTIALARAGYQAVGLDVSEEALALARARAVEEGLRGDDLEFRCADIRELPFADSSFELLVDRGCFHHLGDEDREKYADEAARILRPGRVLFLRGSRFDTFPFKAITAEAISRHFIPRKFEVSALFPFLIQTDAMTLPANAAVLTLQERAG